MDNTHLWLCVLCRWYYMHGLLVNMTQCLCNKSKKSSKQVSPRDQPAQIFFFWSSLPPTKVPNDLTNVICIYGNAGAIYSTYICSAVSWRFPIASIRFEPQRRGQPLHKGHSSWIVPNALAISSGRKWVPLHCIHTCPLLVLPLCQNNFTMGVKTSPRNRESSMLSLYFSQLVTWLTVCKKQLTNIEVLAPWSIPQEKIFQIHTLLGPNCVWIRSFFSWHIHT